MNNREKIEEAERNLAIKLMESGFNYVGGYAPKKTRPRITICCQKCGTTFERALAVLQYKGTTCPVCRQNEKQKRLVQIKEETEKKKQLRKSEWEEKRRIRKLERLKRLDEIHSCKICGETYTIASYMQSVGTKYERDSGFCSAACRSKAVKINKAETKKRARASGKRYTSKHYARAKQLGQPAEEGITLKKLIARDGLTCALCGLPCFYGGDFRADLYPSIDHIIPIHRGGGHTWDNVQVAHRICNSNKRDLIGEKWLNAPKGGAKQS